MIIIESKRKKAAIDSRDWHLSHGTSPKMFRKACETMIFEISSSKIWNVQIFFLSLHLTQLVRKDERIKTYWYEKCCTKVFVDQQHNSKGVSYVVIF